MDRWTWMALKSYGMSLYVAFATLALWLATRDLPETPPFQQLGQIFGWIPLVGLGVALVMASAATFRMWRWETGYGPRCPNCDGMLGGERLGRSDRGGAYRKCLACRTNVNHKHY